MFMQKTADRTREARRSRNTRLSRCGLALAGAGAALVTLVSGTPASAAGNGGCTNIQQGLGLLCARWDGQSPTYFDTIQGSFHSTLGVGNPRIHVRILDAQNREMFSRDRSWGGNRHDEEARFDVTVLMPRSASRVCASLYEGGGLVDTACAPVYF